MFDSHVSTYTNINSDSKYGIWLYKVVKQAEDAAQWQNACLAYTRPWAQFNSKHNGRKGGGKWQHSIKNKKEMAISVIKVIIYENSKDKKIKKQVDWCVKLFCLHGQVCSFASSQMHWATVYIGV